MEDIKKFLRRIAKEAKCTKIKKIGSFYVFYLPLFTLFLNVGDIDMKYLSGFIEFSPHDHEIFNFKFTDEEEMREQIEHLMM